MRWRTERSRNGYFSIWYGRRGGDHGDLLPCGLDNKWIPVIVGVCGGILGVVGMLVMTDFPAADPLTAAAVGIVSGLAATGVDQISKQMKD